MRANVAEHSPEAGGLYRVLDKCLCGRQYDLSHVYERFLKVKPYLLHRRVSFPIEKTVGESGEGTTHGSVTKQSIVHALLCFENGKKSEKRNNAASKNTETVPNRKLLERLEEGMMWERAL